MLLIVKRRKDFLFDNQMIQKRTELHLIQCQFGKSPKIISSPEVVAISPFEQFLFFLEGGGGPSEIF